MILADLLGWSWPGLARSLRSSKAQVEYFWIFLQGAAGQLNCPAKIVTAVHMLPVAVWHRWPTGFYAKRCHDVYVEAFLRKRFGRLFWLGVFSHSSLGDAAAVAAVHGNVASPLLRLAEVSWMDSVAILFPVAGLIVNYAAATRDRYSLNSFNPLERRGLHWCWRLSAVSNTWPPYRIRILISFINDAIYFGVISISLPSLCTFSFWIAMAIIMYFVPTRTSRQRLCSKDKSPLPVKFSR